jgi:hypothetical protein
VSEVIARFAAFLQLSDKFLARAEEDNLEEGPRSAGPFYYDVQNLKDESA